MNQLADIPAPASGIFPLLRSCFSQRAPGTIAFIQLRVIFPVKGGFRFIGQAKFQSAIIEAAGGHFYNAPCLTVVNFNNYLVVFNSIIGRPAIAEIIKLFFGWVAEVVEAYQCLTVFKKANKIIGVFGSTHFLNVHGIGRNYRCVL